MTEETPDEQAVEETTSTETTGESSPASSEQQTEEASEPDTSTDDTDTEDANEDDAKKSESLLVTPDELKAIKADPTLSKLYRSLNKGYTERSQARAAEVSQAKDALQLVDALRRDPQGTLSQLAQAAKVQLGLEKASDPDVKAEMTELFGEEVGAKVATALQKLIDARTSGLKSTVESTVAEIKTGASNEATRLFRESHPDLSEVIAHDAQGQPVTVENRMLELMNKFEIKGKVDPQTYLNDFYRMAKSDVDQKTNVARIAKKLAERTDKSASASKAPGSPAAAKVALKFPTGRGAFKESAAMALRGERAG